MIKKNLIILLLIPFLIALIGAATANTTYKIIDNDIKDIKWSYGDVEAFKVNNSFLLEASGVSDGNVSDDNKLTWEVQNKDPLDDEIHAAIREENENFYLDTKTIGNVIITCSNKKGNVYRSMNAIIYDHGAILITNAIQSSQQNIDSTTYYGEYDLVKGEKEKASLELNVKVIPEAYKDNLYIDSITSNVDFDLKSGLVKINDTGKASISIGCTSVGLIQTQSYDFEVIENGINVYDYETLLDCTNRSNNGEIVVLRKSFESLENYEANKEIGNVVLFGNYNSKNKKYNFENEIYRYKTTYNHEFIDKWNSNAARLSNPEPLISDIVYAGLRIQKDLYGNGYTINMHNLTYPTGTSTIDGLDVPSLSITDLYRGPLPFYTLGDHTNMPLIECFGEDNSGLYIDGNNIKINDINMKNCDFSNSLGFLDYVGTTINIHGANNSITNSRVSNGKNVIRAFSTDNLEIKNTILSNARNFLLYTGSNEYIKPDENKEYAFTLYDGSKIKTTVKEFFKKDGLGDNLLDQYGSGKFNDWISMYNALLSTQEALCDYSGLCDSNGNLIYKGSIDITDTFFYRSGVSSIGLDTMFDGAYLYASVPSIINHYLGKLQTPIQKNYLSDLLTTNTGGQSFPVEINISGNTKFYDYKKRENIDISGLITENMSQFAKAYDPTISVEITIDKIFPVKEKLISQANKQGSIYKDGDNEYICCPIAYYGGANNFSKVTINSEELSKNLNNDITIDLLSEYVKLPSTSNKTTEIKHLMQKAVTMTIGYEPFKFVCLKNNGYLFNESPNIKDLRR